MQINDKKRRRPKKYKARIRHYQPTIGQNRFCPIDELFISKISISLIHNGSDIHLESYYIQL